MKKVADKKYIPNDVCKTVLIFLIKAPPQPNPRLIPPDKKPNSSLLKWFVRSLNYKPLTPLSEIQPLV